ncbi:MAG: YbaK/EbsC family protein [Sedimentisphaerales bacterium]|nr:YbaK/EbsC family protein [Sedimentisphaerales bacterium]
MSVLEYLNIHRSPYRVTEHKPVYSARQLARIEHVSPRQVAKPVVIEADEKLYLCVLPADRIVDLYALQHHLKAKEVKLADEQQLKAVFRDTELGAEAPLGQPYDLPVLLDKSLTKDKEVVFLAGSHRKSIWMDMEEYIRLTEPEILSFSLPDEWPPASDWPGLNPFWPDGFIY